MLSPGDGIALAGVCVLAFKIIDSRYSSQRNGCRDSDVCSAHSGVEANIKAIQDDIKIIRDDVKTLIGRN